MFFLDSLILDATESLCRRFQVLTGRTNVWLAMQITNISIIIYFVWAALYFWNTDNGRDFQCQYERHQCRRHRLGDTHAHGQ